MNRTGGCQCGHIRYSCGDPISIYVCHCTDCRAQSAAAFGISYSVRVEDLMLSKGTPSYFEWSGDGDVPKRGAFCPNCGTRLWHASGKNDPEPSIKAGSLDDPVDITQAIHIWTDSKLPGVDIPDGNQKFPKEPE
jgi:hypothetical protein